MKLRIQEVEEEGDSKMEDGWKQLTDQISRRWELLGVCYSKIGDRKVFSFLFFWSSLRLYDYHYRWRTLRLSRASTRSPFLNRVFSKRQRLRLRRQCSLLRPTSSSWGLSSID